MANASHHMPRFQHRSLGEYLGMIIVLALVLSSIAATAPQLDALGRGLTRLFAPSGLLAQMFPPDISRIDRIALKLLETLQMAVAGAALGLIFALPFAILATDRLSPHPAIRIAARGVIALFRTIPDLVWAIFFIIMVGLGPAAGVLAIMVDKIGFAGRFFAAAMEEADPGPQDALRSIGGQPDGGHLLLRHPRLPALLHRHLALCAGKGGAGVCRAGPCRRGRDRGRSQGRLRPVQL